MESQTRSASRAPNAQPDYHWGRRRDHKSEHTLMSDQHENHRERLRDEFWRDPQAINDTRLVELLLTFVIPQRDVYPEASELVRRFGGLQGLLAAPSAELNQVKGIGKAASTMILAVREVASRLSDEQLDKPQGSAKERQAPVQTPLFVDESSAEGAQREMRIFANDEIENALSMLPLAKQHPNAESFRRYLRQSLPYGAETTRQRRTSYLMDRFFPDETIDTPLAAYAASHPTINNLGPAVFYQMLRAEPLVAGIADDMIWPALPVGEIHRDGLRHYLLQHFPNASASTQKNVLRSVFNTYELSGQATVVGERLIFGLHQGTLAAFAYLLAVEYPEPGIYPLADLERGRLHRWLLWDRDWIRSQLYVLQERGYISKVSEIDTLRQFTMTAESLALLRQFWSAAGEF